MKKKDKHIGSDRLFSFRSGDRSEYLAIYALSRIAYVTPVPRQEDFGVVDFKCVLAKHEGIHVVPKAAFNVQVKSDEDDVLLTNRNIRWISTNMDSPLFLCTVDKHNRGGNTSEGGGPRIKFFSCLNMGSALCCKMHPRSITLVPKEYPPAPPELPFKELELPTAEPLDPDDPLEKDFDLFDLRVPIGPAVVDAALDEFDEEEGANRIFEKLYAYIKLDRINVALMRLGRAVQFDFASPGEVRGDADALVQRTFFRTINQHGLLDKICPLLESLKLSYDASGSQPGAPDILSTRATEIQALINAFKSDIVNLQGINASDSILERLLG